ncbi:MAG: hypothetical protein COA79_23115 [Planctomycetota bacterium]|nr:MAG: hypothetical protein COA79_23115 [Planctomycetota bacterium]
MVSKAYRRSLVPDWTRSGNPDTWPDIIEKSVEEISDLIPLDPDIVPRPLKEYIFQIARSSEVPPEFVLSPLLSVIGTLIGTSMRVKSSDTFYETANLWGVNIGTPSQRKAAGIEPTLRYILKVLNRKYVEQYEAEYEQYKYEIADYQGYIRRRKNGKAESEEPIPEPKEPLQYHLLVNNVTSAMLTRILSKNDRGLFMFYDELSVLLDSTVQDHNSELLSKLLTYWKGNSGEVSVRKGQGASDNVDVACVGLFGTIQPRSIKKHYQNLSSSGFIQRFSLLTWPDQAPVESNQMGATYKIDKGLQVHIHSLLHMLEDLDKFGFEEVFTGSKRNDEGRYMKYSPEAFEMVNTWLFEVKSKISKTSNVDLETHYGKFNTLVHGLSLIFYVIEELERVAKRGLGKPDIGVDIVSRVLKLCEFYELHARKFYCEMATVSKGVCVEDSILSAIDYFGSEDRFIKDGLCIFSERDLNRKTRLASKDSIVTNRVLNDFEKLNYIYKKQIGKKKGWAVNPKYFNEIR